MTRDDFKGGSKNIVQSQKMQNRALRDPLRERFERFLARHFYDKAEASIEQGSSSSKNDAWDAIHTLKKSNAAISRRLIESYSEPTRHYHDLTHIHACLTALDAIAFNDAKKSGSEMPSEMDFATIELALWYHDVIYDAFSKTNEADSARRMNQELASYDGPSLTKATAMILASANHTNAPKNDPSLNLFLDLDLGILGQPPEAYARYADQIRAEYRRVPAPLYYYARKKMLKKMLKARLYRTSEFIQKFEEQAKTNIAAELKRWPYRLVP